MVDQSEPPSRWGSGADIQTGPARHSLHGVTAGGIIAQAGQQEDDRRRIAGPYEAEHAAFVSGNIGPKLAMGG